MNPATDLHWSQLSNILTTPAHFAHYISHDKKATAAMEFGTCVDACVFETTDQIAVFPGERRAGNDWKAFQEENEGARAMVTLKTMLKAEDVADAIMSDPVASTWLSGASQRFIRWKLGTWDCAGTPDVSPTESNGRLSDLKVTNPDPDRFYWHAIKMRWPAQLAWYERGLKENSIDVEEVGLVAVNSTAPYTPTVYRMTPDMLDMGRRMVQEAIELLIQCVDNDHWPGYAIRPIDWDAPQEDKRELEHRDLEEDDVEF